MRIYAIDLKTGSTYQTIRSWRKRIELDIDTKDNTLKRSSTRGRGLVLIRNKSDVTVTDYGVTKGAAIEGKPLVYGAKYAWLEHQDLLVGSRHLLRWEAAARPGIWARSLQFAWVALLVLLLLPFVGLAVYLRGPDGTVNASAGQVTGVSGIETAPASTLPAESAALTPTPAPRETATPTATLAPAMLPPTMLPLPTVQVFPTVMPPVLAAAAVDSVEATRRQRAENAAATATVFAAATAAAATPGPCRAAPIEQVEWDPDISMWVDAACVHPGDQYWRLVKAQWLSDEQFKGYHHLFVDVVDEENRRIEGSTFVMSWPDGECKLSIGQGSASPLEHGNNCPMSSPAGSYTVQVEGLPSDVVHGLGLGAVHPANRPSDYMTSFFLLFQRATYEG
jgi:hypothetical protein